MATTEINLPHEWRPRSYQLPAWNFMQGGGKRAVLVWHRRAGKDLFAINWCAVASTERVGLYWHVLPTYNQGRKIVWDGFTRTGRKFLGHFPTDLIESKNDTDMRLRLKTGSIYQVIGTDNPDRLVGANPIGIVFSEYSLQDPRGWDLMRPILAENGGWAMFIYTSRGKNHGFDMCQMAQRNNKKWFSEILVAGNNGTKLNDGTPVISDEIIQDERDSGMPEETIQQEFYCSFDSPVVGSYYGQQLLKAADDGRVTKVPYEADLPVSTAWDLGISDSMSIWFYQEFGFELRLIDYYENSGEGFPHYADVLHSKGYSYKDHWAPHDINVRELGTGKSRIETARGLGINFRCVGNHSLVDGIHAVRGLLSSCYFDKEKCDRGLSALRGYRKEWDDKNMCYHDRPVHDWTSHGADSFRTLAWGKKKRNKWKKDQMPSKYAEPGYDPMNY